MIVHNRRQGTKYTRSRLPVILKYRETQLNKGAALRRELEIKRMSQAGKLKLIEKYEKIIIDIDSAVSAAEGKIMVYG